MRRVLRVVMVIAVCSAVACTGKATPAAPPDEGKTAASSRGASPSGSASLDCANPIGAMSSPARPYTGILDVVGLDITSNLGVHSTSSADPHRLFAKTGLLVHAEREADLTVPAGWATRVSIAWGNQAAEWTTGLHIPACPQPPAASGPWLAFPGGFSVDKAACVPLRVRAHNTTTTVHVSVGARCPG
jgi:hypothetical protein